MIKKEKKITDKVKTFKGALKLYGPLDKDEKKLLAYKGKNKKMISSKAHLMLSIIVEVLNQGWTPDWDNTAEYKWYPWFRLGSGFGFSHTDGWGAHSAFGARLCFKTEELAIYAGRQFESIYKDFLN